VYAFVEGQPWLIAGAVCALYLLFALLTFMPQPHTGGDSAQYVALARSLLERHSYTDTYDPLQLPHTKYPPVFPIVLAAAMIVGLKSWVQLKLVMAVVGAAAVAMTFLWIRGRGRPLLGIAVAMILTFSAGVLDQAHWILSDVPFWLFTMIALWAFDRMDDRASDRTHVDARDEARTRIIFAACAIVATVLAYFTRSAGLPLVIAAVAWLLLRRHWRTLAAFAIAFVPLALLWWLRAQHTGGVEYTQEFWLLDPYTPELGRAGIAQLVARMGENAVKYATIHIPLLLTGRVGAGFTIMACVIVALALYGWALRLRTPGVAELLMPFYIGLLLLWPAVWSGERFILPVFPLLLYYAGDAIARQATRMHAQRYLVPAGGALVVLLLLLDAPVLKAAVAQGRACTSQYSSADPYPCLYPTEREYFDASTWLGEVVPHDAVVISRKPRLFHVISGGLRGAIYPLSTDPQQLFQLADSIHARYVILDRLTRMADAYLVPALLQRPQAFCFMRQFGSSGTTVLGFLPGAAAMPDHPLATGEQPAFPACDASYYANDARDGVTGAR
jgi:hypothetical protein